MKSIEQEEIRVNVAADSRWGEHAPVEVTSIKNKKQSARMLPLTTMGRACAGGGDEH